MAIIDNGFDIYREMPDGTRDYSIATSTDLSIDGETIYHFDPKTGVLQVSMSEEDIKKLFEVSDFPIKEFTLPCPFGRVARFHNVNEIRPLPPRADGTYCYSTEEPKQAPSGSPRPSLSAPPKKTWWQRLLGR